MDKIEAPKPFKIGDFIFAKIRGYVEWPGKIIKQNNDKYFVQFYGTGQRAYVKINNLYSFADNKARIATAQNMEYKEFRDAMEELENDAKNDETAAPSNLPNVDATNVIIMAGEAANDAEVVAVETIDDEVNKEEQQMKQNEELMEVLENMVLEEEQEVSAAITSEEIVTDEQVITANVRHIDADSDLQIAGPAPKRRVLWQAAAVNINENASGSGRGRGRGRKLNNNENKKKSNNAKRPDKPVVTNNFLMVYLPTCNPIGIDLNYKKPESFKNDAAKKAWYDQAIAEANNLKMKLETGQVNAADFPERICLNPILTKKNSVYEEDGFLCELLEKERLLIMERDFVKLIQDLRNHLDLRSANITKAMEALNKIREMNVTKLMLLRNPECVDTIRTLRNYAGNVNEWKLKGRDKSKFEQCAKKICRIAAHIYEGFKKLFDDEPTAGCFENFWQEFSDHVKVFKKHTKNLSSNLRTTLNESNYARLVEAKSDGAGVAAIDDDSNSETTISESEEEDDEKEEDEKEEGE